MRVVVLGAAGLLGRHVVEELPRLGRRAEVIALGRDGCDITDPTAVLAATTGAEVIINCAAWTRVDEAEADPEGTWRSNVLGPENVALAARRAGARLVHLSTDYVFDGEQADGYHEGDAPRPLSVYGRAKWAGEERVRALAPRHVIARVQALYGAGGGNFASRLPELLAAGRPLRVDGERRVQPTWVRFAARALARIALEPGLTAADGTWHLSASGETTWFAFACAAAALLDVQPAIHEVSSAVLCAPAPRPRVTLFQHRMALRHGLGAPPSWRAQLEAFLAERGPRS